MVVVVLASAVVTTTFFSYGLLSASRPPAQININYYYNNVGSSKVLALTFDDGPFPGRTEAIMDVLEKEKVPATFFFIGSRALRYPDLVKQVAERGFEIGNHSFTHAPSVHAAPWRLRLELNLAATMIESVTGQPIRLYRPPFLLDIGSDPTTTFPGSRPELAWAVQDGYVVVGADVDPKDWLATSSKDIVEDLVKQLENGGHIILLHDGSSEHHTVEALPGMIKELRKRGYTFATASDLLGLDAAKKMVITHDLKLGAVDAKTQGSVTALQEFLIMTGFPIVDQGGVYGPSTQRAVATWQGQRNVGDTSGQVNLPTRLAIVQALEETTYQPLPPSKLNDVFLFTQATRLYMWIAPYFATGIVWIVKSVLLLVAIRLFFALLLRGYAVWKAKAKHEQWKGLVSVIIPAYNEEENIGATVKSVLRNTYRNIQVLVINDGSKDNTEKIVQQLVKQHPKRLQLLTIENGGKAQALNYGFARAQSDVVVTLDGDTIFDRETITNMVQHFRDPNVGAVAGKVCTTRSRNILNLFQAAEYVISQNMDKQGFNTINAVGIVPGPVGAWRKSFVLAAGGYSVDTLVEDQDLTLALLAAGHRVVYEPQARAYSETPYHVKDFAKQRFRWIFGTVQCLWKYKRYTFSFRRPALGWAVLPNTFFFTVVLPLLIPLMDILLILALVTGFGRSTFLLYLIFVGVDFTYAALAFWQENRRRWLLLLLPVQRIFYRVLIFLVVARSVIKAIEGAAPNWNKVRKRGDVHTYHLQLLQEAKVKVSVDSIHHET